MISDLTIGETIAIMRADIEARLKINPECEWAQAQGRTLLDLLAQQYEQGE